MAHQVSAIKEEVVVIVGAGISGLTFAERILQRGLPHPVIVIEKENSVGGLARSFRYGDYIFDIGPHRFHSYDDDVVNYIEDVLGNDKIIIDRSSGVWMFSNYHDWPLRPKTIFKLPFHIMLKCMFDLFSRPKARNDSFTDFIIERYGHTLYEIFFRPYTEKFLKYDCKFVHRDWASTGISRAVIDKKAKTDNIYEVLKSTLMPAAVDTKFIYPRSGGNGEFCEKLKKRIEALGGQILLSEEVVRIDTARDKVERVVLKGGRHFKVKDVFWTAPISELVLMLTPEQNLPKMDYISTILVNYIVDGQVLNPYQWCYFGTADSPIERISIPNNFNDHNAPPGKSSICVELTCNEGDNLWQYPESMDEIIRKFLVKTKVVNDGSVIRDVHFERVANTYPLYKLHYRKDLETNLEGIKRFHNVCTMGRTGGFWYNNQDHSIKQAIDFAKIYMKEGEGLGEKYLIALRDSLIV